MDKACKEEIISILEDDIIDMEAHSYNNYIDNDKRNICMTVRQIKWLHQLLTDSY